MNTNIHVNVNEIPPEVAERIGRVFIEYHKRFLQDPKLMAELEASRAARHPNHKGSESGRQTKGRPKGKTKGRHASSELARQPSGSD